MGIIDERRQVRALMGGAFTQGPPARIEPGELSGMVMPNALRALADAIEAGQVKAERMMLRAYSIGDQKAGHEIAIRVYGLAPPDPNAQPDGAVPAQNSPRRAPIIRSAPRSKFVRS